jgi:hypothetical protein
MFAALKSVRFAFAAVLLLLGMLVLPLGAAHAASQSVTVPIVSPNSRVCLQPVPASSSVDVMGTASNNAATTPQATFSLHRSTDGGATYSQVWTITTTGVHAIFSTAYGNFFGPGLYKWCGRNTTASGETISLSIDSY